MIIFFLGQFGLIDHQVQFVPSQTLSEEWQLPLSLLHGAFHFWAQLLV